MRESIIVDDVLFEDGLVAGAAPKRPRAGFAGMKP